MLKSDVVYQPSKTIRDDKKKKEKGKQETQSFHALSNDDLTFIRVCITPLFLIFALFQLLLFTAFYIKLTDRQTLSSLSS